MKKNENVGKGGRIVKIHGGVKITKEGIEQDAEMAEIPQSPLTTAWRGDRITKLCGGEPGAGERSSGGNPGKTFEKSFEKGLTKGAACDRISKLSPSGSPAQPTVH